MNSKLNYSKTLINCQRPHLCINTLQITLVECLEWFKQQTEANAIQLLLLQRVKDTAAQKARGMVKQKKLTDFFKK